MIENILQKMSNVAPPDRVSTFQQKWDFCWLIVAMDIWCRGSLGKSISGCLALPNIINYYWSQLWPHSLLYHPMSCCVESADPICACGTLYFEILKLVPVQQTRTKRHKMLELTAYSSGVTFSTSNTTASKLFFRSEEPLSLRDSELLLF